MLSSREAVDLLASWLTISAAFSIVVEPSNPLAVFPLYLIVVGTAFVLHELGHKFAAIRLGYYAEYRLWTAGLVLALFMAIFTGFVFAAPGAVYVLGYPNRRENGIISLAGPLVNFIVAVTALLIRYLLSPAPLINTVLYAVFTVNAFIGFFNMLPFYPLDGSKVLAWSPTAYFSLMVPLFLLVFFPVP
ncbi:MAG: hypothetical protein PWP76_661 [Candidatus Diapherotrites archaeon]|nr:hypothetical protein [Candidatus Diapherotrites archaeon]MDN5367012.1 hypothetical protein [Candidatus Diapherotrites archaeon]